MNNRYFMTVQDENVLDILIYGDITSWEWDESDVSSYTLTKVIEESGADEIFVRINSYGGEVAEGLAIYNALKNHPAKVVTMCDGFACSAASVVFMAGDERIMNEASLLMIHNAWTHASGNAKELRKAADDLEKISSAAANTYRAVMSISEEELCTLLENEEWILPEEAVSYGFATCLSSGGETKKQQYSAKKKVYEQLVSGRNQGIKPEQAEEPDPAPEKPDGLRKLFDKFKERED